MPATSTVNGPEATTDAIVPRSNSPTTELERRIGTLLDRYGLLPDVGERLMRLVEFVSGDPLAPTTVRDPAKVLDDHLADSLVALELTEVQAAATIADSVPVQAFLGSRSRSRSRVLRWRWSRAARGNARSWSGRSRSPALGTPGRSTPARSHGPRVCAALTSSPRARSLRWTWWPSMQPRCCASEARSWRGVGVGISKPRQQQQRRPRAWAWKFINRSRWFRIVARSTVTSTSCRSSGRLPERFPRRPGVARKRPLGSEMTASDRVRR